MNVCCLECGRDCHVRLQLLDCYVPKIALRRSIGTAWDYMSAVHTQVSPYPWLGVLLWGNQSTVNDLKTPLDPDKGGFQAQLWWANCNACCLCSLNAWGLTNLVCSQQNVAVLLLHAAASHAPIHLGCNEPTQLGMQKPQSPGDAIAPLRRSGLCVSEECQSKMSEPTQDVNWKDDTAKGQGQEQCSDI